MAIAPTLIGRSSPSGLVTLQRQESQRGYKLLPKSGFEPFSGRLRETVQLPQRHRADRSAPVRFRRIRSPRPYLHRLRFQHPRLRAPEHRLHRRQPWRPFSLPMEFLHCRCFIAGRTCAATSSILRRRATESATDCESPVIMATWIPAYAAMRLPPPILAEFRLRRRARQELAYRPSRRARYDHQLPMSV